MALTHRAFPFQMPPIGHRKVEQNGRPTTFAIDWNAHADAKKSVFWGRF